MDRICGKYDEHSKCTLNCSEKTWKEETTGVFGGRGENTLEWAWRTCELHLCCSEYGLWRASGEHSDGKSSSINTEELINELNENKLLHDFNQLNSISHQIHRWIPVPAFNIISQVQAKIGVRRYSNLSWKENGNHRVIVSNRLRILSYTRILLSQSVEKYRYCSTWLPNTGCLINLDYAVPVANQSDNRYGQHKNRFQ